MARSAVRSAGRERPAADRAREQRTHGVHGAISGSARGGRGAHAPVKEFTLPTARETLALMQAALVDAQKIYDRTAALAKSGSATEASLDDARKALDVARAQTNADNSRSIPQVPAAAIMFLPRCSSMRPTLISTPPRRAARRFLTAAACSGLGSAPDRLSAGAIIVARNGNIGRDAS
jgi:hypothetical protein